MRRAPTLSPVASARTDIERVLADPCASDWLKTSLKTAERRDPVDAITDATVLMQLLHARAEALLAIECCPNPEGERS